MMASSSVRDGRGGPPIPSSRPFVMTTEPLSVPLSEVAPELRRRERSRRLTALAFLVPAGILAVLFLYCPLVFIVQMSFTTGSSFLSPDGPVYTVAELRGDVPALPAEPVRHAPARRPGDGRRPVVRLPVRLHPRPPGALPRRRPGAHGLPDVRGPVHRLRDGLHPAARRTAGPDPSRLRDPGDIGILFSLPAVVFAMSIFTFPFMVMNIGTALRNVDPTLEEAAACLGARPWQTLLAGHPAADPGGGRRRHADGLRLEHRRVRRAAAAGLAQRAALAGLTLYQRGVVAERLRPVVDDGHRPARRRVHRDVLLAALLAWSPGRRDRRVDPGAVPARLGYPRRRVTAVLSHAYIWLCLVVFVLPFLALSSTRSDDRGGTSGLANYRDALGSFADNLSGASDHRRHVAASISR